jgi:hypothetical protein
MSHLGDSLPDLHRVAMSPDAAADLFSPEALAASVELRWGAATVKFYLQPATGHFWCVSDSMLNPRSIAAELSIEQCRQAVTCFAAGNNLAECVPGADWQFVT